MLSFLPIRKCCLSALVVASVSACTFAPITSLPPGTTQQEVLSRYGKPDAIVALPGGNRMQYSLLPAGQTAVMVDLNAEGKVVAARQVLNINDFARVVPGQWTRRDTLREFGRPSSVERVANWAGDILVYRWLNVFDPMLFHVYLDANQVVQQTGTGMEYLREPWD